MTDLTARRGFLRGLLSLPLIGGGVTLIGNPTGAAEPVTDRLLRAYDTWLQGERNALLVERYGPGTDWAMTMNGAFQLGIRETATGKMWNYTDLTTVAARFHHHTESPASSRAAVVLSAVGCDWRAA